MTSQAAALKVAQPFTKDRPKHTALTHFNAQQIGKFVKQLGHKLVPLTPYVLAVALSSIAAHAQGSPFDSGLTSIQTLFTGTVAKVASLVAIVMGGYGFAHGDPGAKKNLAGVAAGTGIAVLAVNVLTWLWGV